MSVLSFAFWIALAATLGAQTVTVDPRYVEFNASTDHDTVVSGQAVLTGYTLQFFLPGATQPVQSQPLGKPAPDASNIIRIDMTDTLTAFPPPGVVYEAKVAAVGPGGSAASSVSNQFQFTDPCAVTLSPTSRTVTAGATTGSFTVATGSGCTRSASSNQSWLTITSGGTVTGSGTVSYSVTANPTTLSRAAAITIGGATFTINQAGVSCTFAASPTSVSVASGSSSNNAVSVTAPAGCGWTSSSGASWLTISGGSSGSGSGTVTFSATTNTSSTPRSGTLNAAGIQITVNQAGASCSYTLSPTSASVGSAAGTGTVSVSTPAGCTWSAGSAVSWASITSGLPGSGNGTVTYSFARNTSTTARQTTLTIAGRNFTLSQSGASCSYTVTPTSATVPAAGGTASFNVTATASCAWTAATGAAWIGISAGQSGSGSGTVSVLVAANSATGSRTGTLTIAGSTIQITQAAAAVPGPPANLRIVR